jgi:hypothetical protein
LVWHKKFGPAQNILGPVKGQGISDQEESWKVGEYIAHRQLFIFFIPKPAKPKYVESNFGRLLYSASLFANLVVPALRSNSNN